MSQLFQTITIDLNEKENETVQTMDDSWEESFSDASVCGSVETMDLLELGDEDEDDDSPEFYYYDDDADYLDYDSFHKNSCIQRAMEGFTGIFSALSLTSKLSCTMASTSHPVDIVLTHGVEESILFQ